MRKFLLLTLMLLLMSWGTNAQTAIAPSAGDGSSGSPYQIANLENLYWIAQNSSSWNKYFIQTADINASATSGWGNGGWTPIGYPAYGTNAAMPFTGSYDGQGHTIDGLTINRTLSDIEFAVGQGLLGYVSGATIQNLGNINISMTLTNGSAGGLVGTMNNSTITNCYSTGNITCGADYVAGITIGGLVCDLTASSNMSNCFSTCNITGGVCTLSGIIMGGLIGNIEMSTIKYSYSTGDVTDESTSNDRRIGGLLGRNIGSLIDECFSTGNVTATIPIGWAFDNAGGLVGYNTVYINNDNTVIVNSAISNCYSTGSVTGGYYAGGLVGYNRLLQIAETTTNYYPLITNCYSISTVIGENTTYSGGLVGYNSGTVTSSFWNTDICSYSGYNFPSGDGVGTGKTTAEMKTQSTFTDADWDFTNIWSLDANINDGYPNLVPESSCNDGTLALSSAAGTDAQSVCKDSPIGEITYLVGGGATGASVSPELPVGLSSNYNPDTKTFTISGTPTEAVIYNYTVTTTGTPTSCNEATSEGTITVKINPTADQPNGDGTSDNPYQIATLENLYWITTNSSSWNKHFIQTADIDASETADWCTGGWLPIGDNITTAIQVFSGTYDGQGYTISGLHITNNPSYMAFGLFGTINAATI